MKKFLIFMLIVFISFGLSSCDYGGEYKYAISQGENHFRTKSYTRDEQGCLRFKDSLGNTITICGDYTIHTRKTKNNDGNKRK